MHLRLINCLPLIIVVLGIKRAKKMGRIIPTNVTIVLNLGTGILGLIDTNGKIPIFIIYAILVIVILELVGPLKHLDKLIKYIDLDIFNLICFTLIMLRG